MTSYRSRLYQCVVRHVRDRPTRHAFSYRYFTFCLDLDEIDSLSAHLKLFGTQRSKIYRFQESDYLITRHDPAANKRIKAGVLEYARQNGVTEPIERVELVTNVRVVGYVFNPVVFYYCYASSGTPVCIIPEVGNTYGEKKLYFLGAAYEDHFDFSRECEKALDRIAEETRETAQFCMLDGNKYTVVRMREGARPFRISTDIGQSVPIPWTASGRLLVAHMTNEEILTFIPPQDFQLPGGEWLDPQVFLAEVRQAGQDGFFTFNSIVDSFTHCFAVPVRSALTRPDSTHPEPANVPSVRYSRAAPVAVVAE